MSEPSPYSEPLAPVTFHLPPEAVWPFDDRTIVIDVGSSLLGLPPRAIPRLEDGAALPASVEAVLSIIDRVEKVRAAARDEALAAATTPCAATGRQVGATPRNIRRRSSHPTPRPLTDKQNEAFTLVAEHNGNKAAAARAAGISRAALNKRLKLLAKKLPEHLPTGKSKRPRKSPLPTDRRGQVNVAGHA
jgi:hypothetical protein